MIAEKLEWRELVYAAAGDLGGGEIDLDLERIPLETPPKPELGDLAIPMFIFSKPLRKAPALIAQELCAFLGEIKAGSRNLGVRPQVLEGFRAGSLGEAEALGPYLNIRLRRQAAIPRALEQLSGRPVLETLENFLDGRKVLLEFSSPNTNKPLHLGHLRNNALGESVSRILKAHGAEVRKYNLVNNRGVHICKSMLAYRKFSEGETPESTGMKSDHFVGKYYVIYAQWEKENPEAEKEAQKMLQDWEAGDPETLALWEKMNAWALDGIKETYAVTGVSFDQYQFESETYLLGKQIILEGLEKGVFYRDEEGTILIDLEEIGLDKKVVLRKDGTSVYITQDIGTAVTRHQTYPFNSLVYVVASEQQYHFRVLFHTLNKLGFEWSKDLHHLSYGMVNLPEGKMKSREGTVVDADELLAQLSELAREEILAKNREEQVQDLDGTARAIALGALHYFLLQQDPTKDMVFNPKESMSFNGNTGPYLQYTCARISSMLRKAGPISGSGIRFDLLESDQEWELFKLFCDLRHKLSAAAKNFDPSIVCAWLYELARAYSRFYHDIPVLSVEDKDLRRARLELSRLVREALALGMRLINVPVLESM